MAVTASAAGVRPAPDGANPIAEVVDVFKVYREGDTETVALRSASLRLNAGEFVSLVGPSGSGKSTLLSILAGLTLPTAGRVLVHARDISRVDEATRSTMRAESIGLVFQRGNLVPFLSAEENVALALVAGGRQRQTSRRPRELLSLLGVDDRRNHRPHQLSGGEAQRVGIAVALANQPSILLGDEITGELDSETAARVMDILLELRRATGLTLLVVTHNPDVAALADRRLSITDGTIGDW